MTGGGGMKEMARLALEILFFWVADALVALSLYQRPAWGHARHVYYEDLRLHIMPRAQA